MKEKEIKSHTIFLMVCTALLFDLFSVIPFVSVLVFFFAFLTFFVWFKLYGVTFIRPKRLLAGGLSAIIEMIPAVSIIPSITLSVLYIALSTKVKKVIEKAPGGKVVGHIGPKSGDNNQQSRRAA